MAAANTVEVRKPKVTVGGEATDSIVYQATVPISSFLDGSPTIRYSSHKAGGDRVENPTAKELIEKRRKQIPHNKGKPAKPLSEETKNKMRGKNFYN